jgi:uncharacterized OB-fold protein
MTTELERPLPEPTPVTRPFWDALGEGKVRIQRCEDCAAWVFYPRNRCSRCLSDRLRWEEVSGEGVLYTFTVARQPTSAHFVDDVPQLIAVVELDQGVRLTTNLVNVTEADIHVGMRLKPSFDRVSKEVTLLKYQPA